MYFVLLLFVAVRYTIPKVVDGTYRGESSSQSAKQVQNPRTSNCTYMQYMPHKQSPVMDRSMCEIARMGKTLGAMIRAGLWSASHLACLAAGLQDDGQWTPPLVVCEVTLDFVRVTTLVKWLFSIVAKVT